MTNEPSGVVHGTSTLQPATRDKSVVEMTTCFMVIDWICLATISTLSREVL